MNNCVLRGKAEAVTETERRFKLTRSYYLVTHGG